MLLCRAQNTLEEWMRLHTKHLAIPVSIVAGLSAAMITSAVAQSGGQRAAQATGSNALVTFPTFLTGQDELRTAPNPPNPVGDVNAFGQAVITIDKTTNEVCVNFTDTGLGPFNGLHIHRGDDTIRNGQIVIDFEPGLGAVTSFYKCVIDTDAAAVAANPAGYYLNAHTTAFPTGAISGQLNNVVTTGTKETNLLPTPVRAYDTRKGLTKFAPNTTRTIDLSAFGVPAGARAAIVTVTVTQADAAGFLTVYSAAVATAPDTSNVNFGAAVDAANNITVATDGAGKIKITSGATGNEDVIVDVTGYIL
jgi:CHRD domain